MRILNMVAFCFCTYGAFQAVTTHQWSLAVVLGALSFVNFFYWEMQS
jgi:hypothetical protein